LKGAKMSEVNETLELVKEAQKQGTFNLSEVIKGRGYPSKDVTIYTDVDSAFQLIQLEERMKQVALTDLELHSELEKQAEALAEIVQKSKLVFHMRGVNQGIVELVSNEADKLYPEDETGERADNWYKFYTVSLVAHNLVKVTNADGLVDERVFTYDDILEIRNNIPVDSWQMIVSTMQQLTLAGGYFKGLTDAGFLPKS
jgi:hypothetical protein